MSHQFHWLGDLPNAGYATTREKELSDAMMFYLRGLEREGAEGDRRLLLMMVIEGFDTWRPIAAKAFRGHRISDDELRQVFAYMVKMAGPNPQQQLAQLITIRPWGRKLSDEQARAINKAAGL